MGYDVDRVAGRDHPVTRVVAAVAIAVSAIHISIAGCSTNGPGGAGTSDAAGDALETSWDLEGSIYDDVVDSGGPEVFPCADADYSVTVTTDAETTRLTHYCNRHSALGTSNDVPGYYRLHARSTYNIIEACSSHTAATGTRTFILSENGDGGWIASDSPNTSMAVTSSGPATVTISRLDPLGGIVEGTYAAEIAPTSGEDAVSDAAHVFGTFRVCHLPDDYFKQ